MPSARNTPTLRPYAYDKCLIRDRRLIRRVVDIGAINSDAPGSRFGSRAERARSYFLSLVSSRLFTIVCA
jgi:hypothetical protein